MSVMLLSSCGIETPDTSTGVCRGLKDAIDEHSDAIVDNAEKTPAPVIITGARVIKGFDEGCAPE